ncbi:unnamed protein product, partial [Hapterophycus canaliculatus]
SSFCYSLDAPECPRGLTPAIVELALGTRTFFFPLPWILALATHGAFVLSGFSRPAMICIPVASSWRRFYCCFCWCCVLELSLLLLLQLLLRCSHFSWKYFSSG